MKFRIKKYWWWKESHANGIFNYTSNSTHYYRGVTKYIDDLFATIRRVKIYETLKILNAFSKQIKLTGERKHAGRFLVTVVVREDNMLKLNWYQYDLG